MPDVAEGAAPRCCIVLSTLRQGVEVNSAFTLEAARGRAAQCCGSGWLPRAVRGHRVRGWSQPTALTAIPLRRHDRGTVMRLLSVNVGTPRQIDWNGRQVTTAIFKHPVDGPRFAGRLNVEGDRQADLAAHGGEHRAVFVYQIESYRYWQQLLGRQGFTYGQFGENFTVEGLPDDKVCIGDRYRIGTAVFEVTQPRVTCYRVGIALGEPRMPALLVSHHRPGFYLRVLHEGMVEAGQEIVKITSGPQAMTVAEIDALLYLPHRSRRNLARALRIPALSQGWKGSFHELLDQDRGAGQGQPAGAARPAWAGFRSLQVMETKPESAAVISITLAPADHQASAP